MGLESLPFASRAALTMSVDRGRPEVAGPGSKRRFLTQLRHVTRPTESPPTLLIDLEVNRSTKSIPQPAKATRLRESGKAIPAQFIRSGSPVVKPPPGQRNLGSQ